LCLSDNVELQKSHLMPKWAYKRVSKSNPPIIVKNNCAIQTDSQDREYLLCKNCEMRFSEAETYVSKLVYTSTTKERLIDSVEMADFHEPKAFTIPRKISTKDIIYFASSVFWRYSVASRDRYLGELGEKYTEKIRCYLMNEVTFPKNIRMCLGMLDTRRSDKDESKILSTPVRSRKDKFSIHEFMVLDFRFRMFLGNKIPPGIDCFCLHRAKIKQVIVFKFGDDPALKRAAEAVDKSSPKGKLGGPGKTTWDAIS